MNEEAELESAVNGDNEQADNARKELVKLYLEKQDYKKANYWMKTSTMRQLK